MASITTRSGKGSPLTNAEVDSNFTNLNTELGQKEVAANKGVANGYASLDASGKVPSTQLPSYVDDVIEAANLAAFPGTGETGKIYVALDTNKTYRWSGSAYVEISASPGTTDAVPEGSTNQYFTTARARASLSGAAPISYSTSTGAIGLNNSGVTAGTYGSSSSVPVLTVDSKGIVTGVSTAAISGSLTFTGDVTGTGSTGSSTNLTLANSGVAAGSYGSASAIPVITVDAKGRLTSVSTSAVSIPSGSLSFTGDVTGTGSTGSTTALTLATTGVTAGTYTNAIFTVDTKGRITSATDGGANQRTVTSITATSGQTIFTPSVSYSVGYIDVYLNGVRLVSGDDYTATNGTNIVLSSGAATGDSVVLVVYNVVGLTDGYTKLEADARYAQEGANTDITSMSGITGGVGTPDYVDFDTAATITPAVGRLGWDPDTGSLQMGMAGGNVSTSVGQTMHAYVTNAESVTITKGQPVYLYQAQGDRATVKLAGNTSDATSAKTLGLAAENIGANQTGYIICQGVINNVNTAAFNAGDTLYLGATVGTLTATKPVAPNHLVYIGVVERANAGSGQIYVRPQNGYELDEIHDVLITSVANGQVLTYESATGLWKNKTVATALGFTPENAANKGVANGYASLDGSGKVPSTQLPSYVDDVLEYANTGAFPATGETGKIYVTTGTNKTYRWSGSTYVEIASSPGSTDAVTEGTTNLYFTQARARSSISASGSLSYNSSTGVLSFTDAVTSVAGKTGVVTLTNSDVGLGNVENKSSATIRGELTSGNVTTALGYTPYNSSNPSGYTSNTGTVTSVSGTGTVSGLTLTGSVTTSGSLTLGGTLSLTSANVTTALGFTPANKAGDTFTGEVKMPNAYFGDPAYDRNANTFEWGGASASYGLNIQDGSGRVNWYWNSNGTTVPTQTVANEDAFRLYMSVDAPALEFFGWEGSTSPAGTAITWTSIFRASMADSAPTFKGNTLLHATNYSSYALPLSGGTMTGSVEVTSGQNVRFGHPSQSDGNDGKIGAGLFGTGLNIVGTQTAAGGGRIIRLWGSLLTDSGLVYIHSGNIGSYVSGGTPTLNIVSATTQTAAASNHYVLTNASATTVTLPASPAAGAVVWVTVANGRIDNVIARNGSNIQSLAEDMTLNSAYAAVQLRYADATRGWVFT